MSVIKKKCFQISDYFKWYCYIKMHYNVHLIVNMGLQLFLLVVMLISASHL